MHMLKSTWQSVNVIKETVTVSTRTNWWRPSEWGSGRGWSGNELADVRAFVHRMDKQQSPAAWHRNCAQYPVINHKGKEHYQRMHIQYNWTTAVQQKWIYRNSTRLRFKKLIKKLHYSIVSSWEKYCNRKSIKFHIFLSHFLETMQTLWSLLLIFCLRVLASLNTKS